MLLGLWAFALSLTAVPELHHLFHAEADSSNHHCMVEQLGHGALVQHTPDPVVRPLWQLSTSPLAGAELYTPADLRLALTRAPPSPAIQIVAVG